MSQIVKQRQQLKWSDFQQKLWAKMWLRLWPVKQSCRESVSANRSHSWYSKGQSSWGKRQPGAAVKGRGLGMRQTWDCSTTNWSKFQFFSSLKDLNIHKKFSGWTHVLGEDLHRWGLKWDFSLCTFSFLNHVHICPIKKSKWKQKDKWV